MYKIIKKLQLAPEIYLMDIEAKRVAKSAMPGQFVIVRTDEKGERIPLTICDFDRNAGSVTIVFQTIGYSTKKMAEYNEGDYFEDFTGPLGNPSELCELSDEELKSKKIMFVAGGVGVAPVYPQVKYLSERGIKADVIIGGKSKQYILFEEKMKKYCDNLYITTDDGSYQNKGLVTDVLKNLIDNENKQYDTVVSIGPLIMMKFVALLTKQYNIKTIVSMNPIMVDGTGMCGACRVNIGGETKFACVDGPEFDGHLVDFDEAMTRSRIYRDEEQREILKLKQKESGHVCRCKGVKTNE